ncbi:MAG: ferric reductase-like transmembrane domain-containing protein [Syntrophales bacterium]|nr:ferric reductase-like transmembrane domain-containing protein [Syntrophales bacterium]
MSLIATLFVLIHVLILIIITAGTIAWINPASTPFRIQTGMAGLLALVLLTLTSLKCRMLRLRYEPWRISHGLLSIAAVGLSVTNIEGVGYYVQGTLKHGFWIALVIDWILALLYVRIVKPLFMLRRPYTVREVIKE